VTRKPQIVRPAPEGGAHTSALNFAPVRLTLAREAQGWTMRQLAALIDTTASAVSQFESGLTRPSVDVLRRLAFVFGVEPPFFAVEGTRRIDPKRCHFRRRRTSTQAERRTVLARGELRLDIAEHLAQHVNFPPEELHAIPQRLRRNTTPKGIEALADAVRDAWDLGLGPITQPMGLLEAHGVLVLEVPGHSTRLDAFSAWVGSWPIIFLASDQGSASRRRFDVMHELGHLLMHPHAHAGDPQREHEADAFASALLLPRYPFSRECPRRLVWPHLLELKRRWQVSLAALVRRAYDLRIFSEATYRRAFVQLAKLGWRMNEPEEPRRELPALLQGALNLLLSAGVSLNDLASELGRRPAEIEQMIAPYSASELPLFASSAEAAGS
jgi:Zn-dependent peptidase ImmA (M78 family)/DNA-binding XRE family transcriptional regulator